MSLAYLLNLLHVISHEYDELHRVISARERSVEATQDKILGVIKELQEGRFELNRLREAGSMVDREAGELANELIEMTRTRDLKSERRQAISELMKQTEDSETKKSLRRERAELGTILEDLNGDLESFRTRQDVYREKRAGLSHSVETLEIRLGQLEREFFPFQSSLVSFEDKCAELELRCLREFLERKLSDDNLHGDWKKGVGQFLDRGTKLLKDYRDGRGLFRRDFQRVELPPLVSELQIWGLAHENESALAVLDQWSPPGTWVETYHGIRFGVGRGLRERRLVETEERLEELIGLEGLVGTMSRALCAVGRTSQTESDIALAEWLRLESRMARANPMDEARVLTESSKQLYQLWVRAH